MRRALSLAAVGSTLVVASAVEVTFSSIKALNTPVTDKDSWSYKGTITGVPSGFDYVEFVLDNGVELNLSSQRPGSPPAVLLDTVTFDADECKPIRKETGLSCKTDGARVTITEAEDKSDGSTYFKISGSFHRREFDEDTLETPLVLDLTVGPNTIGNVNGDCVEKEGAKGQLRATCKPSAL